MLLFDWQIELKMKRSRCRLDELSGYMLNGRVPKVVLSHTSSVLSARHCKCVIAHVLLKFETRLSLDNAFVTPLSV